MKDVNKLILLGRLGKAPVQRQLESGTSVVQFPVATSRRYRAKHSSPSAGSDDEWKEATEWHQVVVWGRHGEACAEHLRSGDSVYVEGRVQSRRYEDKDGVEKWFSEVVAHSVSFLGAGKRNTLENQVSSAEVAESA